MRNASKTALMIACVLSACARDDSSEPSRTRPAHVGSGDDHALQLARIELSNVRKTLQHGGMPLSAAQERGLFALLSAPDRPSSGPRPQALSVDAEWMIDWDYKWRREHVREDAAKLLTTDQLTLLDGMFYVKHSLGDVSSLPEN